MAGRQTIYLELDPFFNKKNTATKASRIRVSTLALRAILFIVSARFCSFYVCFLSRKADIIKLIRLEM